MTQFLKDWAVRALGTWLEGEAGPTPPQCPSCGLSEATPATMYRCFDCYHPPTVCLACIVRDHQHNPFHRVEEWDSSKRFWRRRMLGDLGLVIFLGHDGGKCPRSSSEPRHMTIVHNHGVDTMSVHFCACLSQGNVTPTPQPLQLLQFGLFPGSWEQPMTAFVVDMLRDFHLLSLQSQINAHDYYTFLRRSTNNVFPETVPVSCAYRVEFDVWSNAGIGSI
ncbi:hypothetical protein A0H81_10541 [Grifola frondosa]|uniref:CxC2-like cysteine cluster KDZ transposase-associated domain-containing protein n=1 Tax=Grifola frondosa TaxID=5627 RepID=A0A1C7M0F3_GRIFR|nr:hypothetical protein A0H81_10541 [Grifola frondosa]